MPIMDWDSVHREDIHRLGREDERRRSSPDAPATGPGFLRDQEETVAYLANRRRRNQQRAADMLVLWQQADESVRKQFARAARRDPSLIAQQESWIAARRTRQHAELVRQFEDRSRRLAKDA